MRFTLAIAVMIFVFTAASAFARDPACANHEGVSNLNPFGGRALASLRKCVRLYCSPKVKDASTPDNLKVMDNTLGNYSTQLVAYHDLVLSFQKVCQKLVKNFCQDCADFKEFQRLHMAIDFKSQDVEDTGNMVQQFPPFIATIKNVEGDQACAADIENVIKQAQTTRKNISDRFKNTKCEP